jgi:hypothetical protein
MINVVEFDLMAIWMTYSLYKTKFESRTEWSHLKNRTFLTKINIFLNIGYIIPQY